MTRPRLLLLVALTALTAGCGGLAGGDGGASTETLTPVPVEEARPTASATPTSTGTPDRIPANVLPPGVSREGPVDAARLHRAHRTAVGDRPSVLTIDREVSGADGGVERSRRTVRIAGDGTGTRGGNRTVGVDRNRVGALVDRDGDEPFLRAALRTYFADREATAGLVEGDRRRYVALFVPPGDPPRALTDDPDDPAVVRGYTATVYATSGGRILALYVDYETPRGAVSVRIDHEVDADEDGRRPPSIPS